MRLGLRPAAALAAVCFALAAPATAAERARVASGKTQVVAKVGARELTISELRLEMERLGLSPADPDSERAALESLIERALLTKSARAAGLHKRPEGAMRLRAAQDQALAEFHLALAAQPPEPTREEIERFVEAAPSLFAERRFYEFVMLTVDSRDFDARAMTPLFDREPDFARLAAALTRNGVRYAIAPAAQSGADFPDPIREQLFRYARHDNIVIRDASTTRIMKIAAMRDDPVPPAERLPLARRLLLQRAAAERAARLIARLKAESSIVYYRQSAAPPAGPER
jgi:EpsD family peptidyl-prolyl cis-trans isomerase